MTPVTMLTMHYAKDPEMPVSLPMQSAEDTGHTAATRLPFTISIPMVNVHRVHPSMLHLRLLYRYVLRRELRQDGGQDEQMQLKYSGTASGQLLSVLCQAVYAGLLAWWPVLSCGDACSKAHNSCL